MMCPRSGWACLHGRAVNCCMAVRTWRAGAVMRSRIFFNTVSAKGMSTNVVWKGLAVGCSQSRTARVGTQLSCAGCVGTIQRSAPRENYCLWQVRQVVMSITECLSRNGTYLLIRILRIKSRNNGDYLNLNLKDLIRWADQTAGSATELVCRPEKSAAPLSPRSDWPKPFARIKKWAWKWIGSIRK
ncbi:hypothetical protein TNCV_2946791 [Trichonephila clavipes]|nr:hypothetical protein TNCV_2946791 [Trichonephila clavipes]